MVCSLPAPTGEFCNQRVTKTPPSAPYSRELVQTRAVQRRPSSLQSSDFPAGTGQVTGWAVAGLVRTPGRAGGCSEPTPTPTQKGDGGAAVSVGLAGGGSVRPRQGGLPHVGMEADSAAPGEFPFACIHGWIFPSSCLLLLAPKNDQACVCFFNLSY